MEFLLNKAWMLSFVLSRDLGSSGDTFEPYGSLDGSEAWIRAKLAGE
jgi:hypothetical protein